MKRLLYNQREAAAVLGVGEDYFRDHIRPHLKHVRVGSQRRFPRSELESWVAQSTQSL